MIKQLLMSPPVRKSGFSYNTKTGLYERCAFRCISGQTTSVKVIYRDNSEETKTVTNTLTTFIKSYGSSQAAGVTRVEIEDTSKILHVEFWYANGEFPALIGYPNLTSLSFTDVAFAFSSPYIDGFKSTLKTFYLRYPVQSQLAPSNLGFWDNLSNIESFYLDNPAFNPAGEVSFLTGKTKLKTFAFTGNISPGITDLPNNIEDLIYLTALEISRLTDLRTDIYTRLWQLPLLTTFSLYNNYRTIARVDEFIDETYDIVMAHNITNKTFVCTTIGAVSPPSGVYDGITDWSGGLPTSPRAKIWHMVNSKSHTWTFDT